MPGEFEFGQQQEISEREDRTYARPVGAVYPTFFVGVGGCGSEIVQRIYNLLSSRSDFKDRYEKLIQFVAIDTDMDDLNQLSLKYKFLISDFPKGEYIKVKTGKEYKDPDPFFMQWWPTWYAGRPDSTKGAGQIRVESRLSLYYQLDADRGGLIEQFNDAIVRSKDHDNPYRVVRPPLAYCHIFGSVAGGTGSGGILTLAYLFRELLENHKLSPVMVGHLLLPTLFYRKVRSRLHSDIRSNGYATLKELEWFMTLGYNNNPRQMRGDIERPEEDGIEFNFNPNNKPEKGNTRVTVPPFHLVNIIDEPGDFSFAEPRHIYPAIAGTAYVQLFSPIIGQRESEEDNYYKKIKHLDSNGAFSLNYGTYGLSMLVLPDRDILDYCESRMMKGLLEELCGGDTEGSDTVFFERFKALVQRQVQACKDDPTGVRTIAALRMALEAGIMDLCFPEGEERKTIAKGWQEAGGPSRCGLFHLLQELLQAREKGVDRAVDQLPDTLELTEEVLPSTATGNKGELEKHIESLSRKLQSTISDYQDSVSKKGQLAPEEIQKVVADFLASGMDGRQPGPLSVRLALIAFRRLLQQRTDDLDVRSSGKAVPTTTALQNALDELLFRWKFTGLDAARAAPLP
ncbi:MAG: hypothetical protein FJ109_19205, partial [Deltaproteobacteria bacterium]|nr:hypothetical protein [Deltaproteobacteria bacterium]